MPASRSERTRRSTPVPSSANARFCVPRLVARVVHDEPQVGMSDCGRPDVGRRRGGRTAREALVHRDDASATAAAISSTVDRNASAGVVDERPTRAGRMRVHLPRRDRMRVVQLAHAVERRVDAADVRDRVALERAPDRRRTTASRPVERAPSRRSTTGRRRRRSAPRTARPWRCRCARTAPPSSGRRRSSRVARPPRSSCTGTRSRSPDPRARARSRGGGSARRGSSRCPRPCLRPRRHRTMPPGARRTNRRADPGRTIWHCPSSTHRARAGRRPRPGTTAGNDDGSCPAGGPRSVGLGAGAMRIASAATGPGGPGTNSPFEQGSSLIGWTGIDVVTPSHGPRAYVARFCSWRLHRPSTSSARTTDAVLHTYRRRRLASTVACRRRRRRR